MQGPMDHARRSLCTRSDPSVPARAGPSTHPGRGILCACKSLHTWGSFCACEEGSSARVIPLRPRAERVVPHARRAMFHERISALFFRCARSTQLFALSSMCRSWAQISLTQILRHIHRALFRVCNRGTHSSATVFKAHSECVRGQVKFAGHRMCPKTRAVVLRQMRRPRPSAYIIEGVRALEWALRAHPTHASHTPRTPHAHLPPCAPLHL